MSSQRVGRLLVIRRMARADGTKEELGWLKVVFAVSAAIDASLLAWLAQRYNTADRVLVFVALMVATSLSIYIVKMNTLAYRRIQELKELG